MPDYPYGTPVIYENPDRTIAPLAFIANKDGGAKADLVVMDPFGTWTLFHDVSRSADGGKHTWRTLLAESD